MDTVKKEQLTGAGIDVDGALERLMGSETLLERFLIKFLSDPNFEKLEVLPFHKLCMEKYERLGLEFPLKDTPAMNPDALKTMVEQL